MRWKYLLLLMIGLLVREVRAQDSEKTYYQSPGLENGTLKPTGKSATIQDDAMEPFTIQEFSNAGGIPFWYRRIATEVCLTGDCRPIDVGLFWDCTGDFYGLEVFKEPLTKTDHSDFTPWDYRRLMSILKDDWSPLREYALSELVDEKKEEGVDAVTSATKREISEAAVEKAVYTTHTLWHLTHLGEKEQLARLTASRLSEPGSPLFDKLLETDPVRYRPFLLDLFDQGLYPQSAAIESLIFNALTDTSDPTLKASALHALRSIDLSSPNIQDRLAVIYQKQDQPQKVEMLTSIKPAYPLSAQWYKTLAVTLDPANPWMAAKILSVLKNNPSQSNHVLMAVKKLSESDISVVRKAVEEFQAARAGQSSR
jgi:hypothetical protein